MKANWFEAVLATFPLELHGDGVVDLLFGLFKHFMSRRVVCSLPHIQRHIKDCKTPIEVKELSSVLETHDKAHLRDFPSGLQDFHALRIYKGPDGGVYLVARQFLGTNMEAALTTGEHEAWRGTETGKPLCLIHASEPLLVFDFFAPEVDNTVRKLAEHDAVIPLLKGTESDKQWWMGLSQRYSYPTRRCDFALPLLQRPYIGFRDDSELPERGLSDLFDIIDSKFTDLRKIQPPMVSGFWSSPAAKARAMKALTAGEMVRNGLFVIAVCVLCLVHLSLSFTLSSSASSLSIPTHLPPQWTWRCATLAHLLLLK